MRSAAKGLAGVSTCLVLPGCVFSAAKIVAMIFSVSLIIGEAALRSAVGLMVEHVGDVVFSQAWKKETGTELATYIAPVRGAPLEGRWALDCYVVNIVGQRKSSSGVKTVTKNVCVPGDSLRFHRTSPQSQDWEPTARTQRLIAERDRVAKAQLSLFDLGYDVGSIDGVYGPRTRRAVLAFQKEQARLDDSGELNLETQSMLVASAP